MEGIMTFWSQIVYAISNIRFLDIIDILAVTYIIYIAIKYFRNSRSGQLVKGIILYVNNTFTINGTALLINTSIDCLENTPEFLIVDAKKLNKATTTHI